MCAARTGQILNVASLATDCGISASAAKQWLTVLQASYIITLLRPHRQNFGKRMVKSPKLYCLDAGLASRLLGIRDAQTLMTHAVRGALFETWAVAELHKQRLNQGAAPDLYFWCDSGGREIDVLFETADRLVPFETKSGCAFASDWLAGLKKWQAMSDVKPGASHLIYGGSESYQREGMDVHGWRDMGSLLS
ncbi:MAG: DUF4143 domain-containing protein [Burkholderiaceae bacterium]|nr:DUF4143 domain-containing protein [Burkholderiaceae bacterium]